MRKILLALAFFLAPSLGWAQCTGVFPANTLCGNLSATAQPPRAFPSAGTIVGPGSSLFHGLPIWNNTLGTLLVDGNGQSIPGNYTWISASAFSGPISFTGNVSLLGTTAISGTTIVSGTTSFNGPFQISGSTKTFPAGTVTLGGLSTTQTWSGTNTHTSTTNLSNTNFTGTAKFSRPANFGIVPWFDVKSGQNGCAAAVGDGTTDDTSAIQCSITYISTTSSFGGIVFFPPGNYKVTNTFTVAPAIRLIGSGVGASLINGQTFDGTIVHFYGNYGGLESIFVSGSVTASATASTVLTDAGTIQQTFRDCNIWGGAWAIQLRSSDFLVDNCFILGTGTAGGNAYLNGAAGWFNRVKFDDAGGAHSYGIYIDPGTLGAVTQENAFDLSDFSGNFTTAAVFISNTNAWTQFTNSTFSNPVILNAHTFTTFATSKFGSYVSTAANKTAITGSRGLVAITATNATCAANYNITC